ncbi:hypothetical protein KKG71_00705 [Patescibacteria group bacterium]|nr:hypothetical protein [Patescibacteria group bacterium]
MGFIFTILGGITTYRLWEDHRGLAIFAIVITLYQASSLSEMFKEKQGSQPENRAQTTINMVASFIILGLFIYSLAS